MHDPSAQLIEVDGWNIGRFGMVTSLSLDVQGPGSPHPSLGCFQLFGDIWGLCQHNFSKTCIFFYFPEFSVLNKHISLEI